MGILPQHLDVSPANKQNVGMTEQVQIVDSHTGGEPTRVIIAGGPDLGDGSLLERREHFRDGFDHLRRAVVLEPRGSDVLVGALLCEPVNPKATCGVIFFNNVDYLNMCGHGTIGLMVTLRHLGRLHPGQHLIETPVGDISAKLLDDHRVEVCNVPSWLYRANVPVDLPEHGTVHGDIVWGGNWFFLCSDHGQSLNIENHGALSAFAKQIRSALDQHGITGADDGLIDHIELCGPSPNSEHADGRNFVLCPGGAFDRSPCGTGTSAKMASLAAEGKLKAGDTWRQEGILGSVFEGSYVEMPAEGIADAAGPVILPTIVGSAWVTSEATLILESDDPYVSGIAL